MQPSTTIIMISQSYSTDRMLHEMNVAASHEIRAAFVISPLFCSSWVSFWLIAFKQTCDKATH